MSVRLDTAESMQGFAERLAGLLAAGDLLVLSGGLGAGKTTFTQGLARGLGVAGRVTSPTFVIAREHASTTGGPTLVHVDAYRLGGLAELDDLDLDSELEGAVTVVEWGTGLAEELSDSRLEVSIDREALARGREGDAADPGDRADDVDEDGDEPRLVTLTAVGPAWGTRRAMLAELQASAGG